MLRDGGYKLITHRERYDNLQFLDDPPIIYECGRRKEVLITTDKKMEFDYAAEIMAARIAVVIVPTNKEGVLGWLRRLLVTQDGIREQLRLRKKPFVLRISLDGELTQIKLYRKDGPRVIRLSKLPRDSPGM